MESSDNDYATSNQLESRVIHALSPTEFGKAFGCAAKESKSVEVAIRDILVQLIKSDTDTSVAIKSAIEKHNNDNIKILAGFKPASTGFLLPKIFKFQTEPLPARGVFMACRNLSCDAAG
ncbi:MAG: hypothetical protein PHW13_10165 [Methylococcales bacterium]|nr:hypothetical protein [Methylococcales bacterium]